MNSKPFENQDLALITLLENSTQKISQEKYGSALSDLRTFEDSIKSQGNSNPILLLGLFHNISLCYQRTKNYTMVCEYLNKSITLAEDIQNKDQSFFAIFVARYEILRTLQLCSALSFEKNHSAALRNSKKTTKKLYFLFENISNFISKYGKKGKVKKTENLDSGVKVKKMIEKVLSRYWDGAGVVINQEWAYTYNMCNIMTIQPFQLAEWNKPVSLKTITSLSFISKSIFLLVGSYFTQATETRILESQNKDTSQTRSKDLYKKCLSICKSFFPSTSSLFQHIQNSFKKHIKPLKKEEKKSIVPTVHRIYTKRNSEKPRNTSEKSNSKQIHSKVTPPRKLTPSIKNVSIKAPALRLKKSVKNSSRENLKYSSVEMSKSSTMFRECLDLKGIRKQMTNVSDSDSFDCKKYLAEEFKHNFVMTSNLLYGELNDSYGDGSGDTFRNLDQTVKEM